MINKSHDSSIGRVKLCNIHIDNISMSDALKRIEELIRNNKTGYIVTPNADHIVRLQNDSEFKEIYDSATLVLVDGVSVILAALFLGAPLKEKISGSDLTLEICKLSAKNGYKLFFLGGRLGAAEKAKLNLEQKYPQIKIAGTYCPLFGFENHPEEEKKIIDILKNARPDILLIGLGAPKQEKWIYNHYKILNIPVSIGVGAVFEFMSGMVKRAPVWMQKIGLEWFWRLMMEPRRLWKRYLVDDVKFFWLVLKEKLRKRTCQRLF